MSSLQLNPTLGAVNSTLSSTVNIETLDMSSQDANGAFPHTSQLEELCNVVTNNTAILSHYLKSKDLPHPSLESNGPTVVVSKGSPQSISKAQQELVSAAIQISQLAMGPSEFLPNLSLGFQYISCLTWLCQYNVFHLVPLEDTISYEELATKARVPEQRIKSMIRMGMTNMLFREHSDGKLVGHSATSAMLARDSNVYAYATYMCTRSAPMAMKLAAAHDKWGADTVRTYETAYNVAFNTDLPFFDHLGRDKERVSEFAAYMRHVRSSDAMDLKHLISGYNWEGIQEGGIIVDVGGSTGTAAIALAQEFPHLSFIVQDLPANAESGRKSASESLPKDVMFRVTFQGHDFTQPQPVHGANAYLLRMILHDWSDAEAITILRNIIASMDPATSRLLIMDTVLPKPGSVPVTVERIARARDLTMLQAFNSKERHLEDWQELISTASSSAELVAVVQPFGSAMSVMEVKIS